MVFRELLEIRADRQGSEPFLFFRDQTITFHTLDQGVNKAANSLRELGVRRGDHVCLLLPNCPDFIYLWFALAKIGGVMVPVNVHLRGESLSYVLNHCEAKWLVLDENLYQAVTSVENDLTALKYRVWRGEGPPPSEDVLSLRELTQAASDRSPPTEVTRDQDPLGILYTSGTTGPPKGAIISHFNYLNTGKIWAAEVIEYREDDVYFTVLPLFHANAQMFTTMGSLYTGRPLVLRERFSASRFFDEIRQYGATVFSYIGAMPSLLLSQPEREDDADNPARMGFGGSPPSDAHLAFERRFGVTLIGVFGLTESGGISLFNRPNDRKIGSCGKATSFCEVTIWDENGREPPNRQPGEILIKEKVPYSMFLGYYKEDEKTEEAWKGGWFHTGDRGYRDEEGYFYFVDRMKDCIRHRGENISSYQVEKVVNSHPKVSESAAVAVPSELYGEDVKICVVLTEGEQLVPEDLISFCEGQMAYFMVPRYVEFLKELPKTPTQKIRKFELRKRGIGDSWDRDKAGYKLRRL